MQTPPVIYLTLDLSTVNQAITALEQQGRGVQNALTSIATQANAQIERINAAAAPRPEPEPIENAGLND